MVRLLLLLLLAVTSQGQILTLTLTPEAFLKLNDSRTDDSTGTPRFGNGAATGGAFDATSRLLYVIGTQADSLNIIDLSDPVNPRVVRKLNFNEFTDGFPDSVALCVSGNRQYLAVSFEKLGTTSKAFIRIFKPLSSPVDSLDILFSRINLDGYDPTAMAWSMDCGQLVVVQQGRVHRINGQFDDPDPTVDIITPGIGESYTRTNVPISGAELQAAGVRLVLQDACGAGIDTAQHRTDLEPRDIFIDSRNVAYITFPKNNAFAKLQLGAALDLQFFSAGVKEWRHSNLDVNSDQNIKLENYPIHTFYQPMSLTAFSHNGETYLATADMGEIYSLSGVDDGCQFEDSLTGTEWVTTQFFGTEMSAADRDTLRTALNDKSKLGQMRFTKLHTAADGYDGQSQGFNRLTGFGGRGVSVLKASNWHRVYESGNLLEAVFAQAPESTRAVFNAELSSPSTAPSSYLDRTSPLTGPTPRAIVSGEINGTLVLVAANGLVGGVYAFTVDRSTAEPIVFFHQFLRRGNAGLPWETSYRNQNDDVGEPETKDIVWIDVPGSQTEARIAVLGNRAGVVSFYRVTLR